MAMRAYNRCTARLIPRSWLLERCGERGDYVVRGGRLLSVLSQWRDLQKPNSIEVLSAFLGEAQIVGGVLELVMSKVREETGRQIKFNVDRTAFLIIVWQSSISRFRSE